MPEHLGLAVLLAAWCQLRRAEVLGLRRRDVDVLHRTLSVVVTRTATMNGDAIEKAPKTEAGRRTVAIPPNIVPTIESHLSQFVDPPPDAYVFPVSTGELRRRLGQRSDQSRPDGLALPRSSALGAHMDGRNWCHRGRTDAQGGSQEPNGSAPVLACYEGSRPRVGRCIGRTRCSGTC
jgi:integrase